MKILPFSARSVCFAVLAAVVLLAGIFAVPSAARADLAGDAGVEGDYAAVYGPDAKEGFKMRQETWGGVLEKGDTKPIGHTFYKGNEYRLYITSEVAGAKVSVHIYDTDGNLAESRAWQKTLPEGFFAGADIRPKASGRYYLIVKVEESPKERLRWSMAYSYK